MWIATGGAFVTAGVGSCAGVGTGLTVGVWMACGFSVGFGEGFDDGVLVVFGVGDVVAATVAIGVGVDRDAGVAAATVCCTIGVGVCVTTIGVGDGADGARREANAERSAPIPRPATITPAKIGTIGRPPPRSSSSGPERRLRGGSELINASVPQAGSAPYTQRIAQ